MSLLLFIKTYWAQIVFLFGFLISLGYNIERFRQLEKKVKSLNDLIFIRNEEGGGVRFIPQALCKEKEKELMAFVRQEIQKFFSDVQETQELLEMALRDVEKSAQERAMDVTRLRTLIEEHGNQISKALDRIHELR